MTPTCVKDDDRSPIPVPKPSSELGVPAELRRVDDKMMAMRIRWDKRQQRRRSRSQSRPLLEVDVGSLPAPAVVDDEADVQTAFPKGNKSLPIFPIF